MGSPRRPDVVDEPFLRPGSSTEPEHLLQVLRAVGATERGVTYMSVPITSGWRELTLARRLGCGPREVRGREPEVWERLVRKPNEYDAHEFAKTLRAGLPMRIVIDPSEIDVADWDQYDYLSFWSGVISEYVAEIVLGNGWEFSRGARMEVNVASSLGLGVYDEKGHPLSSEYLIAADRLAKQSLMELGFSEEEIDDYLPILELKPEVNANVTEKSLFDRPAAYVLRWLRDERSYQVQKFGCDLDDDHTRAGLEMSYESWWWRQLTNYYKRACVLGLEAPVGRQALAKFVATSVGLLESVVRVNGDLPVPGVPSGYNLDSQYS